MENVKRFRSRKAIDNQEYLEVAQDVAEHLNLEGKDDLSYYEGRAGIIYFYIEMYQATKEERYKKEAIEGLDYIDEHWKEQLDYPKMLPVDYFEYNIYSGVVGVAMTILTAYDVLARESEKYALQAIAENIIAEAHEQDGLVYWSGDPVLIFDSGITLFLFKVAKILGRNDIKKIAYKAAKNILRKGQKDPRGGIAWDTECGMFPCRLPNFELGTAGVGYALGVFYEYTGDSAFLEGAKAAAFHLEKIAVPQKEGWLIPYYDNEEEPIFYVASCHGPAGSSRLFYQLYRITRDEKYLEAIDEMYKGLVSLGVPEIQSAGYWNNLCICCGTAGVLQFFLNYSLVRENDEAKQLAIRAGEILLGEGNKGAHGIEWSYAWTRVEPENVTSSDGYANGAAGIASALLQLYLYQTDKFRWDRLLEDPYPQV